MMADLAVAEPPGEIAPMSLIDNFDADKIGKKLFVTFPNQQDLQAVSDEVIECDSIPPQFAPLVRNTLEELVFDPHCAVWMKFVRVLMKV